MSMTRISVCIFLALIPVDAAVAQTEVPLGSRIVRPIETTPLEKDDSIRVRDRFAACVYKNRPERVDALLASSDILNVDYEAVGLSVRRIGSALSMESCLSKATSVTNTDLVLKTNFPSLREMLLEQSYRAHNPTGPDWLGRGASPPERRFVSKDDALVRAQAVAVFADCVVAAAPREADALIRTPVDSPAEKAALSPLVSHLAPCIPEGMEVKLDPARLRALVADGLWASWRSSDRAAAPAAGPAQ